MGVQTSNICHRIIRTFVFNIVGLSFYFTNFQSERTEMAKAMLHRQQQQQQQLQQQQQQQQKYHHHHQQQWHDCYLHQNHRFIHQHKNKKKKTQNKRCFIFIIKTRMINIINDYNEDMPIISIKCTTSYSNVFRPSVATMTIVSSSWGRGLICKVGAEVTWKSLGQCGQAVLAAE